MSNCTASCKGKKKHGIKRKRRRDGYIKSTRPFAPEYSTSTISKAINLVYGRPELPNVSRYQDLPGTTHFNIFHRTGVPNGNDVLGHVVDYQQNAIPNNHGVSPGSDESAHTGHDANSVYTNMTQNPNTPQVDVNVDESPVRIIDFDQEFQPGIPLTSREQALSTTTPPTAINSSEEQPVEGNEGNLDEEFGSQTYVNPIAEPLRSAANNSQSPTNPNTPLIPMGQSMAHVPPAGLISGLSQQLDTAYNEARGSSLPNVGPSNTANQTQSEIASKTNTSPANFVGGRRVGTPNKPGNRSSLRTNKGRGGGSFKVVKAAQSLSRDGKPTRNS